MAKINKKNLVEEGDLDFKNIKIRIIIFVDGDVLLVLRKKAEDKGIFYQIMLNDMLRVILFEGIIYDVKRLLEMAEKINCDVE